MTYQHFAYIYDELMKDVPYESWLEYFLNRIPAEKRYGQVLDLACGTGSLSVPIAKMGFDVTGIDLSTEMLSVADEKARNEQVQITFLEQDMTNLVGTASFDLVLCFCDSLNYLKDEQAVTSTFKGVYDSLKSNGQFMFDVHSTEKIESIFMDQTFVSTDEEISFIWNCFEGDFPYSVEHELTFFVNTGNQNLYKRYDEVHVQRTYPIATYEAWLKAAGFSSIEVTSDFKDNLSKNERERILFYCEKK
ncbi:class I SAM-dependent DNA methyltransferase [Bacillus sp. DJP31]|uniref:class I SAM-dependent DNA methyltransferase n=1 Tax=Bacillus sp. DJP31 TaxID=3409789 RepID=UPI003BB51D39